MDLLIIEVALVRRSFFGLVTVREESGSVGSIIVDGRSGDGAVVEAD